MFSEGRERVYWEQVIYNGQTYNKMQIFQQMVKRCH